MPTEGSQPTCGPSAGKVRQASAATRVALLHLWHRSPVAWIGRDRIAHHKLPNPPDATAAGAHPALARSAAWFPDAPSREVVPGVCPLPGDRPEERGLRSGAPGSSRPEGAWGRPVSALRERWMTKIASDVLIERLAAIATTLFKVKIEQPGR